MLCTIEYIIENYPATETRSSSGTRQSRASSAEPPAYPFFWATDIPTFKKAVRALGEATVDFRQEPEVLQYINERDPVLRKSIDKGKKPASQAGVPDRPENPSRKSPSAPSFSSLSEPSEKSNTSPPAGRRDPASTSSGSSSQADQRSTRDTSASEAIYSHPIGPRNQGMAGHQDPAIQALLNDPQIQAVVAATAAAAVAQYVQNHPPPGGRDGRQGAQGPVGPQGPTGPEGPSGSGGNSNHLKADDVGYFDPSYEDPNGATKTDTSVVNAGRHVFYRDVYAFQDRLKDLVHSKGEDKVKEVLPTCLRGSALIWHSTELTELEKRGLRNASVDEWCETLVEKFKEKTSVALRNMQAEHYTMNDARQGRTPRSFAHNMLRHAKAAMMTSDYNQLCLVWNNLGLEFRRDIPEPTPTTTIGQFLGQLDSKESLWYEMARQHSRPQTSEKKSNQATSRQSGQYGNRQGGFSKSPFPFQPFYEQSYQGYAPEYGSYNDRNSSANRPYQSQQAQQGTSRQANPALPAPRQPLQITAGNTSNSTGQSSNQPRNPRSGGGRFGNQSGKSAGGGPNRGRAYPSRPFGRQGTAYQGSESYRNSESYHAGEPDEDATNDGNDTESSASASQDFQDPGNYFAADEEGYDYLLPRSDDETEGYFASAKAFPSVLSYQCRQCQMIFLSKNELHRHLGNPGRGRRASKSACQGQATAGIALAAVAETSQEAATEVDSREVIRSTADSAMEVGTGHAFRGYHYAVGSAKVTEDSEAELLCFDTGCSITLVDRAWFEKMLPALKRAIPGLEVRLMTKAITVRGLGSNMHQSSQYAVFPLLLPGKHRVTGKNVTAMTAPREVHIVEHLKAKMLIGMDIMVPEKIDIILSTSSAHIGSCQVEIPLEMRARGNGQSVLQPVHAKQSLIIPPRSETRIPVHHASLPDRDFFFEPAETPLSLYAHLVDASMTAVVAKNDTDYAVKVPRNLRLGTIQEANFDNCYHITEGQADATELATRRPEKEHQGSWIKRVFKRVVAASAVAMLATSSIKSSIPGTNVPSGLASANVPAVSQDGMPEVPGIPASIPDICVVPTEADSVMPNGVTVYQGNEKIQNVVNQFPSLWEEGGFAEVPQEDWMRIPLKADWEAQAPKTARVYPLGKPAQEVVDRTFDKLHDQGKMEWTTSATPFSYPVFVVWRIMPSGERKGRAVVDIRGLNLITQPDLYPLPLQADLISSVKGCRYISVIDCASFFYQWRVHPSDRHKLTVVTHRGQEYFNVAVMGYKNSPAYVQRQIDRLLREYRSFARAYVDDVVVFSKTLEEHVGHLKQIFALFSKYGISVNPAKAFLGYPSVQLLGQKVDSLGLWTAEDKLQAISRLSFPTTLAKLETYLGMTGWLRDYIAHYAAIAKPLQDRKTLMLAHSPRAGNERKNFATRAEITIPSESELQSFYALQAALSKPSFLTHFDDKLTLYVDLDASKDFGFGAMVYHVFGNDPGRNGYPQKSQIRPILFLSRLLKDAETRYWPTELELAGIVWVLTKTRHMVESAPHTVVYTDHGAALGISKQTSMTTSSTAKLNLRLIRASEYIQRFRSIEFRHKPGKQHIIPDALSRLSQTGSQARSQEEGQLDLCYHITLVEMSESFKSRLVAEYAKDPQWNRILEVLRSSASDDAAGKAVPVANAGTAATKDESRMLAVVVPRKSPRIAGRTASEVPATPAVARSEIQDAASEVPSARKDAASEVPATPAVARSETQDAASEAPSVPAAPPSARPEDPVGSQENRNGLRFKLRNGLIYYTNHQDGKERLCVPNALEKEIFELGHDRQHHGGFHRTYDRIAGSIYLRNLVKHLRSYIEHCPECELNQTRRHKPYGSLIPIDRPGIPFHTIAMDFIVSLPVTATGLDSLLTITDKFSKRILLLPGKTTYSAAEWAEVFLANLSQHGWGIPVATISDRDAKFMSALWKAIFGKLGTEILTSTAYHPQTDGQSERTNQTVEIAIRYFVTANRGEDWTTVLPYLQGSLNNSKNQSTGVSPNEILYGFNVRDTLGMLTELPPEQFSKLRQLKRDQAEDSLAFSNATAKAYYDKSHTSIDLKTGDLAFLRLHDGYSIPGLENHKLHHQRIGPFQILEKVGARAYRLRLPPIMKVHPVISIAQLEPAAAAGTDPYGRIRNTELPPVVNTQDEYLVEAVLDKRISRGKTQYLIKWWSWGHENNVWYGSEDLKDCMELVDEYEARAASRLVAKPSPTTAISTRQASGSIIPTSATTPVSTRKASGSDIPPPPSQALVAVKRGRGRPKKT